MAENEVYDLVIVGGGGRLRGGLGRGPCVEMKQAG